MIDEYRQAAIRAMRAGFDAVEIHAGNGYLVDQFLRDSDEPTHRSPWRTA